MVPELVIFAVLFSVLVVPFLRAVFKAGLDPRAR